MTTARASPALSLAVWFAATVCGIAVANPDDRATALSCEHLIRPLFKQLSARKPDWDIAALLGADATKARLGRLLGGDETPALLFTASHGMEFPISDARQLRHQGAS